jgi:Fur family ferric uptake transcriptional regulator
VADDPLKTAIRAAGLRATKPRLAVLRALSTKHGPLSHADLTAEVGEDIDRATLYRNLNDLAEVGLLRRLDVGDHTWRFEFVGDGHGHAHAHAHFTCTECGDVTCLPAPDLGFAGAVPGAVSQGNVEVHLRGVCDDCAD